jgi:hypothetical protein
LTNAVVRETRENGAELFRFTFRNKAVPLLAYVSDDGKYVVGLDRYMSEGMGIVLVIYSKDGALPRCLTLEQISGETAEALDAQLKPSITRRPWARRSIIFFSSKKGRDYLCIWMSWSAKWALVDLESGDVLRDISAIELDLRREGFRVARAILTEVYDGDFDVGRNVLHQDVEGDAWRRMLGSELSKAASAYMNYMETLPVRLQRWVKDMVDSNEFAVVIVGEPTNRVPSTSSGH